MNKNEFDALPRHQQRLWIARDVIARIDANKIVPKVGQFWSNCDLFDNLEDDSVKNALEHNLDTPCEVCAKGGLFVTWAANFNEVDFSYSEDRLPKELMEIFGEEQLTLIEIAFEGEKYDWWDIFEGREFKNPIPNDYIGDIRAIMQNIVDNGGTFIFNPFND